MLKWELVALWCVAYLAALAGFGARMAYLLFGISDQPPEDPIPLAVWRRKRRWLVLSEFCALPLFATAMVAGSAYANWSPALVVLGSMGCGALGFAFLLHALQTIVNRKVENA